MAQGFECLTEPTVSIIVPVYKVEQYLRNCVDSLLAQTYTNIEIILVDDGSPDTCPAICDEYAAVDGRVRVIHKENGGLSDARNAGIDIAKGEWICFVDSDDFFNSDVRCKVLFDYLEQCENDYLFFTAINEISATNKNKRKWRISWNIKEISREKFLAKGFFNVPYQAAWLFIVKRDFIISNNLYFKVGILHEDEQWMPRVVLASKSEKIPLVSVPLYCYRLNRAGSIVNNKTERNIECKRMTVKEFVSMHETVSDKNEKRFLATRIAQLLTGLLLSDGINHKDVKNSYNDCIPFLKKSMFLKHKILFFVNKVFPK